MNLERRSNREHLAELSSLSLLGLEYFHEYLDRYSAKEQMRKGSKGLCLKCAREYPTPTHSSQSSDLRAGGHHDTLDYIIQYTIRIGSVFLA